MEKTALTSETTTSTGEHEATPLANRDHEKHPESDVIIQEGASYRASEVTENNEEDDKSCSLPELEHNEGTTSADLNQTCNGTEPVQDEATYSKYHESSKELHNLQPLRYAGMEVDSPKRSLQKRSSQSFCKDLYLNQEMPTQPLLKPRIVCYNYQVDHNLIQAIKSAIKIIERAAPGLSFQRIDSVSAEIYFAVSDDGNETDGSLRYPRENADTEVIKCSSLIKLKNHDLSTAIHEILHALGFDHEHQRRDAHHYIKVCKKYEKDEQVEVDFWVKPLTPFDEYSIMLYKIGEVVELRRNGNITRENYHMSEWDKIALNFVYCPARVSGVYEPTLVPSTGMYYCGRSVMKNHNQPGRPFVTTCGQHSNSNPSPGSKPDSGPNCPACRIISRPHNKDKEKVWQGRTGFVYCGKDGCGPEFNEPCDTCGQIINYKTKSS